MKIKVAFLSYPMLFQRFGGLQLKITETIAALNNIGVDAALINPTVDKLESYDVIHVFAAVSGNHRIVQAARSAKRPVIMSPILGPPLSRWRAVVAAICDRMTRRLTGWEFDTSFGQIRSALLGADRLVAMGQAEKKIIVERFGVDPKKVTIVPNGISQIYFDADPRLFVDRYGKVGFALVPGSISSYKNQLSVVKSLRGTGILTILLGPCETENYDYLKECLAVGQDQVMYLGCLSYNDPMLASAYAAAGVVVLASRGEAGPQIAPQALAAGTPVVLTKYNGLDLESDPRCFVQVSPNSVEEIRSATLNLIRTGDATQCRSLVKNHSWADVASALAQLYEDILGER